MTNKDIAWAYFEHLNHGRFDEAFALFAPDGKWWVSSRRCATSTATMEAPTRELFSVVPMQFTLHGAIEEGDQVALEIESHAPLPGGKLYNNVYCFVFTVRDGDIVEVHEYADTAYAAAALPAEGWAAENKNWRGGD